MPFHLSLKWRSKCSVYNDGTRYKLFLNARCLNYVSFKELEADFKSHVPGLDLPTLLSELSSTRPLYTITPSKELRQQYCVAIMYLLRFDLVIQLHMYLVLLPIPKEVSPTSTSDDQLGSSPTDDWLKRFASDKAPREVADLFQRYSRKGWGNSEGCCVLGKWGKRRP